MQVALRTCQSSGATESLRVRHGDILLVQLQLGRSKALDLQQGLAVLYGSVIHADSRESLQTQQAGAHIAGTASQSGAHDPTLLPR